MRFTGVEPPGGLPPHHPGPRHRLARWLQTPGAVASIIRRKLAALYQYLCEKNAVFPNPVKEIQRPKANTNDGTTPALSHEQARALLKAPPENTLQGIHDRAIFSTLLLHGIRREEPAH